jgi:hypothetical protein
MSADPAGTSVQNMLHFQQGVNKDNWCKEDFGYFGNKQVLQQQQQQSLTCQVVADVLVGACRNTTATTTRATI